MNTYIIKSEIYCENQIYWGKRWVFKHLLNDDTEFAVRMEVGKLFHRAGAANEKLYLQQIGVPSCETLVQRDVYCLVQSEVQCVFGDNGWNKKQDMKVHVHLKHLNT